MPEKYFLDRALCMREIFKGYHKLLILKKTPGQGHTFIHLLEGLQIKTWLHEDLQAPGHISILLHGDGIPNHTLSMGYESMIEIACKYTNSSRKKMCLTWFLKAPPFSTSISGFTFTSTQQPVCFILAIQIPGWQFGGCFITTFMRGVSREWSDLSGPFSCVFFEN